MGSKLGSALSCVQVTMWATPVVCSLMSKLLIQRGMDSKQSEIALKARETEQTCLFAKHLPNVRGLTGWWEPFFTCGSLNVPSRCWLEMEHEN